MACPKIATGARAEKAGPVARRPDPPSFVVRRTRVSFVTAIVSAAIAGDGAGASSFDA
jgi:hypothetical protein